jgi:N-acetylglucosamine-6-sulfatase
MKNRLTRRAFLHNTILAASAVPLMSMSGKPENPEPPNIVFIFSDDHALRTIGAYDGSINKTPNIDSIAENGMLFKRSYCANSICVPSRACILTGKHSHINGMTLNGSKWDGKQFLFPRALQQNGYETALIGKWHMTSPPDW